MRIPTADGDDLAETDGQVRVASGKSPERSPAKEVGLVAKLKAAQDLERKAKDSGVPHLAPVMQTMSGW